MRPSIQRVAIVATLLAVASPLAAQRGGRGNDSTGRGAGLPLTPAKPLKFTTDEGTWLSLDVSPDGRTIVFEMLGDIYTIPVDGGKATRLTSGQPFDAQPHFSPDGKSIVFVSDRSQADNLWLMNADGSNVRALTRENDQRFQSPTFTPDGKYVVASRGNDLFMYYVNGGTGGLRLTGDTAAGGRGAAPGGGRGAAPPNVFLGPAVSHDGRYIYTAMRNSTGGGYNQTALGWQIGVFDRETGRIFTKTNAVGSGMRPEVSADGKWLAYATRNNAETSLMLRDLESGDERLLLPKIQRDDQESRPNRDVVPTYAFTPDSKAIVIGHHGHFWRANVADGHETMIPFSVDVDMMIAGPTKETYPLNDESLVVRQIRDVAPSPDNKRLAFTALDRLWVMDLPNGTPRRLVPSENVGEFQPTWSPDGQYIAYVTWNDIDGGTVSRARSDGSGQPQKLSSKPAYYEKPAYSLDGRRVVVGRGPRNMRKDLEELERPPQQAVGVELVWLPSAGGAETLIAPISNFGRPHFVTTDTSRIYFSEGSALVSMRWDGTDQKTILRTGGGGRGAGGGGGGGGGGEMTMSPDGSKVIVQAGVKAYLIEEVPKTGNAPTINATNPAQSEVPVRRMTTVGGEFASWSRDSRKIYYALGHSLFTYDVAAAEAAVRDSVAQVQARGDSATAGNAGNAGGGRGAGRGGAAARPIYEATRNDVAITIPKDKPQGTVVLRGARILTMKGREIIPKGDIVVKDNRIVGVGAQGKVTIPSGAKIIDVSGKTILPGYVDVHAHMWPAFGVHRSQPFEYLINLAYGVTTTRDPQTSTTDVLSYSDMVEAGEFIGPRIFSTGPGVFAAENIRTIDDAREVLRRYSEFYNTETIKQYMTGDRRVRQLLIMAAREQHLMPTLEGGLDFKKNLTEAMDGYSGSEHTLPIAPLYKDVLQLYANSGTTWTPTLIVQYGGPWAENYWYENSDVVNDPKLNRFTPRDVVERKTLRRPGWWAPSQWSFQLFAEQAAKLVAAGGHVGMGSHGQLQGLGAQWEIWNIASGGMPRYDVLRVATIFGAEAIGHEKDLGSLEGGKLADLQVLDKNPLDDIKNTNTIRYVMKNGRLYDGNTMSEIWPRQKQIARLWWWSNGIAGGQDK
jgi:Tol biopolymer transport system component